ncbi:hypothetical protein ACP4OV_029336 [Aristida adscensionis]
MKSSFHYVKFFHELVTKLNEKTRGFQAGMSKSMMFLL